MVYKLYFSNRIYTGVPGEEEPFAGSILVYNGKIRRISRATKAKDYEDLADVKFEQVDFGDLVLMPGLVDSHVHINEPGRTAWEGFATATKAAAAGGFTTIVDMPLNSIPATTTVENLQTKAQVAKDKTFVDLGFWGGVIPGNSEDLQPMVNKGVVGFKCFLCPSGVDEFPNVTEEDVDMALSALENTGSLLAFHAEFEATNCCGREESAWSYSTYLSSRPPEMEIEGVQLVIRQAKKHPKNRLHIVHLATAAAITLIQDARRNKDVHLTVETCHHYLGLRADQIPDKRTEFKCAPPIRDNANRKGLWTGVLNGDIDMIVSDHSPSTPDVKLIANPAAEDFGNFLKAWGGIASVQLGLSLMWTHGEAYNVDVPMVIRLMSTAPAELCGFQQRKGMIKVGHDADFVVWSPEEFFQLENYQIQFKNKANPYLGKYLRGVVHNTILRGEIIYDKMNPTVGVVPRGELLLKNLF